MARPADSRPDSDRRRVTRTAGPLALEAPYVRSNKATHSI